MRNCEKKGSHLTPEGEYKMATAYVTTRASLQAVRKIASIFTGSAACAPSTILRVLRRCEASVQLRDLDRIAACLHDVEVGLSPNNGMTVMDQDDGDGGEGDED